MQEVVKTQASSVSSSHQLFQGRDLTGTRDYGIGVQHAEGYIDSGSIC